MNHEELKITVDVARRAATSWRTRSLDDRVAALRAAAKAMLNKKHEVLDIVREEIGKLEIEGLFNEAMGHLDILNGWVAIVENACAPRRASLSPFKFPKKSAHTELVPRGVVGILAPWNFPIAGLYRSVYPALLTGNGVIVKPSEHAPRSAAWFVRELAHHLPEGLISVVQGAGDVGAALVASGIDACVFTGSPENGRKVRMACAELGIPCSVETGGKDAAVVLADCDLERTCAGVTHWALSNVGQACGAIEVALVENSIADDFAAAMTDAWQRLRTGPAENAEISPLANRRQLDQVIRHVEEAEAAGARVLCGGASSYRDLDLYYPPTLLDHCNESMAVVRDETFGPVLAIVRVASAAEAVRVVNRGRYGLGTSIWTRDIERAERLAGQLDVGVVSINNHAFTGAVPELPWSGTRDTGLGVANSEQALSTYTRPRVVVIDRSRKPDPFWMPYDNDLRELGHLLIDAQLMRLTRAFRLPVLMRRRVESIRQFFRFAGARHDKKSA